MNSIPTHVLIPFKDDLTNLLNLLTQLEEFGGFDQIHLFDNSVEPHELPYTSYSRPEATIYEMWNEGWDIVLEQDPIANLAILNDDIVIPPGFLQRLSEDLRSDPEVWLTYPDYNASQASTGALSYTSGTYRHGGMSGWAFMVKAEARIHGLPHIDPQFKWWCGDDDLAFAIEACHHKQARCIGLPCTHLSGQTVQRNPHLHSIGFEDMARCEAKWQR